MQLPTVNLKYRPVKEVQGVVLILSSPAMLLVQPLDSAEAFDFEH